MVDDYCVSRATRSRPIATPTQIADELEPWGDAGADGFVVTAPLVPRTFTDVSQHLLPELDERGLLADNEGETLREQLFGRRRLSPTHPGGTE